MNTRTYWGSYQTRTRQDLFIFIQKVFYCDVIYSHKYVNLLQIIIKDIENEKVRCVFEKNWNEFVVSGF